VGGTKPVLIARLEDSEAASSRTVYVLLSTIIFSLTSCLTDGLHRPVYVNSNVESERALNPELAERDARELQESYETALWGEDGDGEGVESVVDDDDDDDDGDPAGLAGDDLMDVDGPGLFKISTNCWPMLI
jgi:hypothetical protein